MKRSVYSLVLMDDVIKAVDEQAYRLGTSRSNLINQILAERLSCVTPEMRMREIFGGLAQPFGGFIFLGNDTVNDDSGFSCIGVCKNNATICLNRNGIVIRCGIYKNNSS